VDAKAHQDKMAGLFFLLEGIKGKALKGRCILFAQNMPGDWACRSPCFSNSALYGNASAVVREMQGKKAGDRQPRVTAHTIGEEEGGGMGLTVEPFYHLLRTFLHFFYFCFDMLFCFVC
jgi:hypothetical protein